MCIFDILVYALKYDEVGNMEDLIDLDKLDFSTLLDLGQT